jgi:dCMP deaminase
MTTRPAWQDYFLQIALDVSTRSTCLRVQYGAVIVLDKRIIATGYNGAPSGTYSCYDRGFCIRDERGITHGKNYEICYSVHSEVNAIIRADRPSRGSTIYISGSRNSTPVDCAPCFMCKRIMVNAGIKTCFYHTVEEGVRRVREVSVWDWTREDMRMDERDKVWKID